MVCHIIPNGLVFMSRCKYYDIFSLFIKQTQQWKKDLPRKVDMHIRRFISTVCLISPVFGWVDQNNLYPFWPNMYRFHGVDVYFSKSTLASVFSLPSYIFAFMELKMSTMYRKGWIYKKIQNKECSCSLARQGSSPP